jgi:TP901 family phage tail tape measure protein
MVAAGKAALNAAKDFEFSMQKMVGLAGVGQTTVTQWSEALLKMGPEVAKGPKELADALYFISSSGIKGADALNVLKISAQAATAGLGETKDVADFLTSALNAYKGTNLSAAKAADILVAAVREGKGEASSFATAMGSIIPIASQLGVSLDQVAGGMAAITLTGSSTAQAATYLKGVFNVLTKAPMTGGREMASLGAMKTSYGELRKILADGPNGLINLMQKLRDMQMQYGDELMSDILPNIRALTGYLSIAGKNFTYNSELMKRVSNSTGSLGVAFAAVSNTIKVQLDQALSKAQASLIKLGQAIAPTIISILNKLVEKLGQLINWWNSLSKEEQEHKLKILAVMAVMGPLALMISTVIYSVTGLIEGLKTLLVIYKALTTQIAITGVWTKLGVAMKGAFYGAEAVAGEMAVRTGAAAAKAAAATTAAKTAGVAVKAMQMEQVAASAAEVIASQKALKAAKELTAAKKAGINVVNFLAVSEKELAAASAARAAAAAKATQMASAAAVTAATAQAAAAAKVATATAAAAKGEVAMAAGMNAIAVSAEATMAVISTFVIGIVALSVALIPILILWNKIKDIKKQIAEMKEVHTMTVPKEELSGQIDKLLYRNAGTTEKPKWVSRLNDLSEDQLKEAQNLLNQRIAIEQESLDKMKGITDEEINNDEYVYSRRAKINKALRVLDEDRKSGKYDTEGMKKWSTQVKTYIQEVQDQIEKYKEAIVKEQQLKGIMEDPDIKKAQEEIFRLKSQLDSIKRNQRSSGIGMGYSPEVLDQYSKETNMAILEQQDIIQKIIATKREDLRVTMEASKAHLAEFTKQRDAVQRTLDITEKYRQAVANDMAFDAAYGKAWQDMLTKIKVAEKMAVVNKELGISYDLARTKADIYLSSLEDLMAQFGIVAGSPAYNQIMKWLKELGIDFSEAGKNAKKFAEALAAIDMKSVFFGPDFDAGAAKLQVYQDRLNDLLDGIKNRSGLGLAEISTADFNAIDDLIKKMHEAKEASDSLADNKQLYILSQEANLFGTLGAKVEVFGMEIQSAERRLRSMLSTKFEGGTAGLGISEEAIKKQIETIQKLKKEYVELQNAADLTYLKQIDDIMKTDASATALLDGQIGALENTLKTLAEMGPAAADDFKRIGEQLKGLEQAKKTAEILDNAFGQLFDSLVEGGKNMAETLKMVLKSIVVDIIKTYVHMMIMKQAMEAFGLGVPSTKGFNPFNIIEEVTGIGGSATAAKGGIVPSGYLNDTYPVMVTSGERIVPAWKYDEARRKKLPGVEYFDMPTMTQRPPKLAGGGTIPAGFPGDTFPAWLSSGETVVPLDKAKAGGDIIKKLDELITVNKQGNAGLLDFTGMGIGFMQNRENPPVPTMNPAKMDLMYKPIETLGTKIHNILSDMATTTAIAPSQFRYPTPEEFKANREQGFIQGAMPTLNKSAAWMMGNELGGAAFAKGVPYVAKKVMSIPGITADAPDLGYHALLSKKHWAWNPGQLEANTEQKVLLYMEAAANRMIPVVKKTPLMPKIQKIGETIMRQSAAYDRDMADILPTIAQEFPILKKSKYLRNKLENINVNKYEWRGANKYTGAWESHQGDEDASRDLISQYLYGKGKGLEKAGPDIAKLNWPRYQKLYPKAETFMMRSEVPHGQPLEGGNMYSRISELIEKIGENNLTKEGLGIVRPYDNVAGYVESIQKVGDEFRLISQDIWKFNPKDYIKDWSYGKGKENIYYNLAAEKQAGILDKIGKPFYLVQNNPIKEDWIKMFEERMKRFTIGATGVVAGGLGLSATNANAQEGGKIPYGNINMPKANVPALPFSMPSLPGNPEDITQISTSLTNVAAGYQTAAQRAIEFNTILQTSRDALAASTAAKGAEIDVTQKYVDAKGKETEATKGSIDVAGTASSTIKQIMSNMISKKMGTSSNGMQGQLSQMLLQMIIGQAFGPLGSTILGLFSGNKSNSNWQAGNVTGDTGFAQGGIVPPGYPNDTYKARLTSGEMIIPATKIPNLAGKVEKSVAVLEGEVVFEIGQDKLVGILRKANNKNNLY